MNSKDYGRIAAGDPSLDQTSLTDIQLEALNWGAKIEGRFGPSWAWTIRDYGEGHIELTGVYNEEGHKSRVVKGDLLKKDVVAKSYEEFVSVLDDAVEEYRKKKKRATVRAEMNERKLIDNLRRTRKTVREKCMMMKADKLLTFTTRAAIMESEVFREIVTKFLRSCRSSNDGFQYVAVFERHMSEKTSARKYGSLHLHMAISGYCSYRELRHNWRKAVQSVLQDGDYEGANFDASKGKRKGLRSGYYDRARIARYMSKYLTKDMDDEYEPNKRRYWSSRNIKKPETTRIYTAPSLQNRTFIDIFNGILNIDIKRVFMPERVNGATPPIIWLST